MVNRVVLTIGELEEVASLCKQMNADRCTLVQDSSSGIGPVFKVEIKTNINNYYGDFVVDFTDVSDW